MTSKAINACVEQDARAYQNTLTKPAGSLGKLEDIACWFAARQGKPIPDPLQAHIAVFAADHGVTVEGISAFPSVVTQEMVKNFAHGGAAINVLAKQAGASLSIVDVGVLGDTTNIAGVKQRKVRASTANLLHKAAMSKSECAQALQAGKDEAKQAINNGANVLIAGDMGIGNTTASACLICLHTGKPPSEVVGKGTGIDEKTHAHKVQVVEQAIDRVKLAQTSPEHYLHEVGGLEIAAMTGFYLEAANHGVPIIIDGFIASAAALAAQCIDPEINNWMLASHISQENGHRHALAHLNLKALIDFHMRLGEGSGAAVVLPLLQSAIALHREMATFESAAISQG